MVSAMIVLRLQSAGCMSQTAYAMCHAVTHPTTRDQHAPGSAERVHACGVIDCRVASWHDTNLLELYAGAGSWVVTERRRRKQAPSPSYAQL